MSYIQHKDKLFFCNPRGPHITGNDTQLQPIASDITDITVVDRNYIRLNQKYEYFFKDIRYISGLGKYVPSNVLVDFILKQARPLAFEEDAKDYNDKFDDNNIGNDKALGDIKAAGLKEITCDENMDDLKKLKENSYDEDLKKSDKTNENVRKELYIDEAVVDQPEDIISNEKDTKIEMIASLVKKECSSNCQKELKETNQKNQKLAIYFNRLRNLLEAFIQKNVFLKRKLKAEMKKRKNEEVRQREMSEALVDNRVLKEKILARDERIKSLTEVIDQMENQINELVVHIQHMATVFSWKEGRFFKKYEDLKEALHLSNSKTDVLEKKLSASEKLVRELEIVRSELRAANVCHRENSNFCRNQMQVVITNCQNMASTIEELSGELDKSQREIKRLSSWPGSATTSVHLARMNGILQDRINDREGACLAVSKLNKIMKELMKEAWIDKGLEPPNSIDDQQSQTDNYFISMGIQCNPVANHSFTQTSYPDIYLLKFIAVSLLVQFLSKIIHNERQLFINQKQKLNELNQEVTSLKEQNLSLIGRNALLNEENFTLSTQLGILLNNNQVHHQSIEPRDNQDSLMHLMFQFIDKTWLDNIKHYESHIFFLDTAIALDNIIYTTFYEEINFLREAHEQDNDNLLYTESLEKSLIQEKFINEKLENEIIALNNFITTMNAFINDLLFELNSNKSKTNFVTSSTITDYSMDNGTGNNQEIYKFYCEVIDETKSVLIKQKNSLKGKLVKMRGKAVKLKYIMNKHRYQEEIRKQKLNNFFTTIVKIKETLIDLGRRCSDLQREHLKLSSINDLLTSGNNSLQAFNNDLKAENMRCKKIILKMKSKLNQMSSASFKIETEKAILTKNLEEANDRIEILSKSHDKQIKANKEESNNYCLALEEKLLEKERLIYSFQDEIALLESFIGELKENILILNSESLVTFTECSVQTESCSDHLKLAEEMLFRERVKNNQEIEEMVMEHKKDFENQNQVYLKNLNTLRENYERDIKRIKLEHAQSVDKIFKSHQEEIDKLNELLDGMIPKHELALIAERYEQDMEMQNSNFIKVIKDKVKSFEEEKDSFLDQLLNVKREKQDEIAEINKNFECQLKSVKKKCKMQIKKAQDDANQKIVQFQLGESSKKKIDKMTYTEPTGQGDFQYDVANPQLNENELLKRISELECDLLKRESYNSENACDSEKRIWIEKEKNIELNDNLSRQRAENYNLQVKLSLEYQKIAALEEENESLKKQLSTMLSRSCDFSEEGDDLTYYSHKSKRYVAEKFQEGYNKKTEFIHHCGVNHKLCKK